MRQHLVADALPHVGALLRRQRPLARRAGGQAEQQRVEQLVEEDLGVDVFFRGGTQRALPQHQEHQRGADQRGGGVGRHRAELAARHAARQHPGEQLVARHHHLFVIEAGDVGEVGRLGHDQLGQPRHRRGADQAPPAAQQFAQQFRGAALVAVDQLGAARQGRDQVGAHHGLEQLFLVGKVQVDRALGHTGGRRHVFQARGRVAALHEQVERRRDQLLRARGLAPAPARRIGLLMRFGGCFHGCLARTAGHGGAGAGC
ncbi:hypothetical protein D9M69_481460 [compost metagenome]